MSRLPLLLEIGTEELPPKSLLTLADAFAAEVTRRLLDHGLLEEGAGGARVYASPRRLALQLPAVAERQADSEQQRLGPALKAAYDDSGEPSKAALGFARGCGVTVADLETVETPRGQYLAHRWLQAGKSCTEILPELVGAALAALPIARHMRWGDGSHGEFVRPVHWVLALLGDQVVPMTLFGQQADRLTRGHRFHAPQALPVAHPDDYPEVLRQARVVADFAERRELIRTQLAEIGAELGGQVMPDEALLDETTSLVEWPVALAGSFDEEFLEVPAEVLVATMRDHQKYFHLRDADGQLLPAFITIANIDSQDPGQVRAGNERVLRARFSDARFFWHSDLATPLDEFAARLGDVVFRRDLGSVADKVQRIGQLAAHIAQGLDPLPDRDQLARAAAICKADLMTQLVGELPDLQGVIGSYLARAAGEPAPVCQALMEHYLPRHAGDSLPTGAPGRCLALADRIDTLTAIFASGDRPTGDKDPFALRRAALGVIRICVESPLSLDLPPLLALAVSLLPEGLPEADVAVEVQQFITERLRGYLLTQGYSQHEIAAVLALAPADPWDASLRVAAVARAASGSGEAIAILTACDKRVRNILTKSAASETIQGGDLALLQEPAELALAAAIDQHGSAIEAALSAADYDRALALLTELAPPLQAFFDQVLVMAPDQALRTARLTLLWRVHALLGSLCDLSMLQG